MESLTQPGKQDYQDYIRQLYFGFGDDYLKQCIKRAYLDMCRTIHGLSDYKNSKELYNSASEILEIRLAGIAQSEMIHSQEDFDFWHHATCNALILKYKQEGFDNFSYGQAQKWLNMTLKYIYAFGNELITGYDYVYQYAHMPLDNYILGVLYEDKAPKLKKSWSRINKVEYLEMQNWVRDTYKDISALTVEFHFWTGAMKSELS